MERFYASIETKEGTVLKIVDQHPKRTESLVLVDGKEERAIGYPDLIGPVMPGDRVLLNTTAMRLSLGTGGYHFIIAVWGRKSHLSGPGHIMKCRYTPMQMRVLSLEEEESPWRSKAETIPDLDDTPVLVGSLHSQVPVAAAAFKAVVPHARIVYVMTDGGALPAPFSDIVTRLRETDLVTAVITAGHAFGGDYEAVHAISAIAAARSALEADLIIVSMGPGTVGTGTPLGSSSLEQGPLLDNSAALGGWAVPIVRVSFADQRNRHFGISHHVLTVLTRFVHRSYSIPLPKVHHPPWRQTLRRQAAMLAEKGHTVVWIDGFSAYQAAKTVLDPLKMKITTMGRTDEEDPYFFQAAASAGVLAAQRRRLHSES